MKRSKRKVRDTVTGKKKRIRDVDGFMVCTRRGCGKTTETTVALDAELVAAALAEGAPAKEIKERCIWCSDCAEAFMRLGGFDGLTNPEVVPLLGKQ